jgi:aspartate/methionine/tyrosine aminotransferase
MASLWSHYQKEFISNGAYTDSIGNPIVRESVAKFISQRDNFPCRAHDIFVMDGVSMALETFLTAIVSGSHEGVLLPLPCTNDFGSFVKVNKATIVPYTSFDNSQYSSMCESVKQYKQKGVQPKVLIAVNPGYPSGSLLSYDEIKSIIELAHKEKMMIIADESFQEVTLEDNEEFVSFKKVLKEHRDSDIRDNVELISLNSISHTLTPLNFRGGYAEIVNVNDDVYLQFQKLYSIMLCSNTIGQIALDLHARRNEFLGQLSPKVRDLFDEQKNNNRSILKRNFEELRAVLNNTQNVEMNKQNNTFYAVGRLTNEKMNSKEIAAQIEKKVGIKAEPGETFGVSNSIIFDKFSQLSSDQKHQLEILLK